MKGILNEAVALSGNLPTAAWDIGNLLKNATTTLKVWGGLLMGLLGVVLLIIGVVHLVKKLSASPQSAGQQKGYGTIAIMILTGGVLIGGGLTLITTIAKGGKKSLEDLGNGLIVPPEVLDHVNTVFTSGVLF